MLRPVELAVDKSIAHCSWLYRFVIYIWQRQPFPKRAVKSIPTGPVVEAVVMLEVHSCDSGSLRVCASCHAFNSLNATPLNGLVGDKQR